MGILNDNIKKLIDKLSKTDAELRVDIGNKATVNQDLSTEVTTSGSKLNIINILNTLFKKHGAGINDSDESNSKPHETFSKSKILSLLTKTKKEIDDGRKLYSGMNAISNSNFETWGSGVPRTFEMFNSENNRTTALTCSRILDAGIDKSSAVLIKWTNAEPTPKGIAYAPSVSLAVEKGSWYVVAIAARIPTSYTGPETKIELHHTRDPQFEEFEYIDQPPLEKGKWVWTIARFKKPNQSAGDFTRVLFTIDKAYTGTQYELSSPYLSKGYYWSGYTPESNATEIRDVRSIASRQYGVENLIADSGMLFGFINHDGTTTKVSSLKDMVTDYIPVVPNESYRYQAWVNVTRDGGAPYTGYQWYDADKNPIGNRLNHDPRVAQTVFPYNANYSMTIKAPANARYLKIATRWMANEGSRHKLERGLMSTDWSLSSEDIQRRFSYIKNPNILYDPEFKNYLLWGDKTELTSGKNLVDGEWIVQHRIMPAPMANRSIGLTVKEESRKTRLIAGRKYTLSFYASASEYTDINYVYIMRDEGENSVITQSTMLSADETRSLKKLTFIAPFTSNSAYLLIGESKTSYPDGHYLEIDSIKIEEGEFATGWVNNEFETEPRMVAKEILGRLKSDIDIKNYSEDGTPGRKFPLLINGLLMRMAERGTTREFYQSISKVEDYHCLRVGEIEGQFVNIYIDVRSEAFAHKQFDKITSDERQAAGAGMVWYEKIKPTLISDNLGVFKLPLSKAGDMSLTVRYYSQINGEEFGSVDYDYNSLSTFNGDILRKTDGNGFRLVAR